MLILWVQLVLFNFVSIFVGCVRIDPDIAVAVDIDVSRYLELLEL